MRSVAVLTLLGVTNEAGIFQFGMDVRLVLPAQLVAKVSDDGVHKHVRDIRETGHKGGHQSAIEGNEVHPVRESTGGAGGRRLRQN